MTDKELLWLDQTEAAYAACKEKNYAHMFQLCEQALGLVAHFQEEDPRQACSLNNLAVALCLLQKQQNARKVCLHAHHFWKNAKPWIEKMTTENAGRSSLFHMRMRKKHPMDYDNLAKKLAEEIWNAGWAATLNNLAHLLRLKQRHRIAQALHAQALDFRQQGFGQEESGAVAIRSAMKPGALGETCDFGIAPVAMPFRKLAFERHWIMDEPPEFNDLGRLNTASRLTFLLSPNNFRKNEPATPLKI